MNTLFKLALVATLLSPSICMGSENERDDPRQHINPRASVQKETEKNKEDEKASKKIKFNFFEDNKFYKSELIDVLEMKELSTNFVIGDFNFFLQESKCFPLPKGGRKVTKLSIQKNLGTIGALDFLPAFSLDVEIKSSSQEVYSLSIIPEYRGVKFTKNIVSELNKVSALAKRPLSLSIPSICEMARNYKEGWEYYREWQHETENSDLAPRKATADNHNIKWVLSEIETVSLLKNGETFWDNDNLSEVENDSFSDTRFLEHLEDTFSEHRSFMGIPKKILGKLRDDGLCHPLEPIMHQILHGKKELKTAEHDPKMINVFGSLGPDEISFFLFSTAPLIWDKEENEEIYRSFGTRYLDVYKLNFVQDPESLLKKLRIIQSAESNQSERVLSLTEDDLYYKEDRADDQMKHLRNLLYKFEQSRKEG